MFYSHQLLSKKGPFGQIWIAATMHPKMNRRRTEQIDIEESCMQIINPVVPLALRLSGILMGGIVKIFHHKVKFLYDDANDFLMKVKALNNTSKNTDKISLRKVHAKLESVTMETNEMFDDVENPLQQEDGAADPDGELFVVPKTFADPVASEKHQAANEDITLEEDSVRSFSRGVSELEREQEEDRIVPPVDNAFTNDIFLGDNIHLDAEVNLDEKGSQHAQPKESQGTDGVEKPERSRKRGRKRVRKLAIFDEELAEIPLQMFRSWIEDSSSTLFPSGRKTVYSRELFDKSKKILEYPATFSAPVDGIGSMWPLPLLELWRMKFPKRLHTGSPGPDKVEASSPGERESGANTRPSHLIAEDEDLPPLEYDDNQVSQDYYGSVERLRNAVPTSAGKDAEFLSNQLGSTPIFSAGPASGINSKRLRESSLAEKLPLDTEGECPSTGRSKRSRRSERSISPVLATELSGKEFFSELGTPNFRVKVPWQQDDVPSQFEPFDPSQRQDPRENVDGFTTRLLKCFREHFRMPGAREKSLNELAEGMDSSQAARLFFHVCVLASNRYITALQKEAYGDIVIGRGVYL